jgi:hypothetical protein
VFGAWNERLLVRLRLAKVAYDSLYSGGLTAFQRSDLQTVGDGAPDHLVELTMRRLADEYLIDATDGYFFPTEVQLRLDM